jgi:hypothetical protein
MTILTGSFGYGGKIQTPAVHVGVPLLVSQTCPHAPQLSMRVSVFVSQPVA